LRGQQSIGALQLFVTKQQMLDALGDLIDQGCLWHGPDILIPIAFL
jgi:hypothetical protein